MKQFLRRLFFLPLHPLIFIPGLRLARMMRMLPLPTQSESKLPNRILVINLTAYLGDTVMMLPLLDRLRKHYPLAQIDVVTSTAMASFVRQIAYVNHVDAIPLPKKRLPVLFQYQTIARFLHLVRTRLGSMAYELCVLPRWGTDAEMSIYLGSMIGASRLVGSDPREELDAIDPFPGTYRFLTTARKGGHGLPEAVRELLLIGSIDPHVVIDPEAEERRCIQALSHIADSVSFASLQAQLGLTTSPYIAILPGASSPTRRWSADRFQSVAQVLHEQFGVDVLILDGDSQNSPGEEIAKSLGPYCFNLAGRTSLAETTALLQRACLVICNDSGPAHLSAGLGVPTVVLSACPLGNAREFGNSPLRVRPVGPAVRVLQPGSTANGCVGWCIVPRPHCILGISVDMVVHSAMELLSREAESRSPLA